MSPDPLDRPVHTVPHTSSTPSATRSGSTVYTATSTRCTSFVGADDVAQAPDGMPFVASFWDVWLPPPGAVSVRTLDATSSPRELERRCVGVIMIRAPSGSVLLAMRTFVEHVCNDTGLRPGHGPPA